MGGGFSSSTYNGNPCLPPLENSLPCMAWLAWVDQSGTLWKCFIDSWHLDLRCHYLLNYPMNCCMHILFQHYISTVIDEYTIHFDGSYWKYDEMVDQKEVNFSRGAHSTNPCGTKNTFMDNENKAKLFSGVYRMKKKFSPSSPPPLYQSTPFGASPVCQAGWWDITNAQRVRDRIFLLFNKTWKESHQAQYVKCIGNFFPVSNTNVKFWQMLKNIFVNKMAKFQCLGQSSSILLQCLV